MTGNNPDPSSPRDPLEALKTFDLLEIEATWAKDLKDLEEKLRNVVADLPKLEVTTRSGSAAYKTTIDVFTGDVVTELPLGATGDELKSAHGEAVERARQMLGERVDALIKVIDVILSILTPQGTLGKIIDAIEKAQGT